MTNHASKPPPLRVANAPCSWGALEFDLAGDPVGYAQVLDEIRDTGYVGTELGDWGFMPTHPATLQSELRARALDLVGAFIPIAFAHRAAHAEGERRALKTARLLAAVGGAAPFVVLADDNGKNPMRTKLAGRVAAEPGLSEPQWETFCEGVQRVARAVARETGLRSVFHHHCAGFVETPGEVERLLAGTDPRLVGLCFDTGHFRFGGGDPVGGFQRFRERIWHVHWKDCDPAVRRQSQRCGWDYFKSLQQGVFCELGRGDVDFTGVAAKMQESGYRGWIVVEQDVLPGMGAPKEYARRNREFLETCLCPKKP